MAEDFHNPTVGERPARVAVKRRRDAGRGSARRSTVCATNWPTAGAFRRLNVVDTFTREALSIEVDTSRPGLRVTRVLDAIAERRRYPRRS